MDRENSLRILFAGWLLIAPLVPVQSALAARGDCGQPQSTGTSPAPVDALFVLRVAVGLDSCPLRVCDVNASCVTGAIDALIVLSRVVGIPVELDCDGPCSTTTTSTTSTTQPEPNSAPVIEDPAVYRAYPGFAMSRPIDASDADGDQLTFSSSNVPDGCTVDESTGVVEWTPSDDQVGLYDIEVTASDDRVPSLSADTVLTVQVAPLDECTSATCDPASGCFGALRPIDEPCCTEEPGARVGEPDLGCPQGRVLFAGRNTVGFGRLQNCDRLRLTPFAQGGINVRFHIEARCVNVEGQATLSVRLETDSRVLVETDQELELRERDDGYAQNLALVYALVGGVRLSRLEGEEAQLSLRLVDSDGVELTETLRLTLTSAELADLPNPDIEDFTSGEAGCVGCHRPLDADGQRMGIEEAHPAHPLGCTDCHGGDANATSRLDAHVSAGAGPAFIRNLTSDQLDAISQDYLRFVNPGDLRVAATSCGPSGCHPDKVASVRLSTMSTYGGHYTLPRFLAGSQTRAALYAAVDVSDPHFDPDTAPEGAIDMLLALREPDPLADRATVATAIDLYLPKSCPTCHLGAFGRNADVGTYRSSGCTACHMVYDNDGISRSEDPVINENFPPHPKTHELTTAIPVEQCAHCHFQGGRIGLAYRGIREGGFAPEKTPENAVPLGQPIYGHSSDFYFSDEDGTNEVDETPPDLHFTAGLACMDCHVGGDVHGDGNLYSAERYQVGIRCEDCHGSVREEVSEDIDDGLFKNSKGFALQRLRRDLTSGRILLELANDGRELEVPQIKRILDDGANPFMTVAMGVYGNGFSHTDSLECYSCHSAWRQNCFGCHITVDDSGVARNETTGEFTFGASSAVRDDYSLDFFALGMNRRGKLSPLCSSMSILMSYIDGSGVPQFEDRIRTSADGRKGFGWNPFHHHTVSKIPQNCDRCHPVAAALGIDNTPTLLETYGFGNGQIMVEDEVGTVHDLSAFLDEDGELISEFPHPGTGPVPADVRARALAVEVIPQPR